MITNHHWGSTTKVGGSGANLRFTPYNVPLSVIFDVRKQKKRKKNKGFDGNVIILPRLDL